MAFQLPPLPYDVKALEPHIDAQTMEIHHGKHHAGYVNNLNAALEKHPDLQSKSAEELVKNSSAVPEAIRTAVRNNGGGHANHSMFWQVMGPGKGGAPTGAIADAITGAFGSFDSFKDQMNKAGGGAVRQRLGLARRGRRQAGRREHRQPGQPALDGKTPDPRHRRLGARLLPEVPEPPRRLPRGVVERGQLGRDQQAAEVN